jgi:hypothetical protein
MISIAGEVRDSTKIGDLQRFLQEKKYVNTVLSSLGKFKNKEATELIGEYRFNDSEKTRVIVARGLKSQDSEESRQLLLEMSDDPSFLIKTMISIIKESD